MIIKIRKSFDSRFNKQLKYIARDNPQAAENFRDAIINEITKLPINAQICRKSIYFDDESIRDLIYKKYIIVFQVTENTIDVFGFIKNQQKPTDE